MSTGGGNGRLRVRGMIGRPTPIRCWVEQETQVGRGLITRKREPDVTPVLFHEFAVYLTVWHAVIVSIARWIATLEYVCN